MTKAPIKTSKTNPGHSAGKARSKAAEKARSKAKPGKAAAEPADPIELAARAASEAAVDKKATEPVLLDVKGHASYADFILILSGQNERHVGAISDAIEDRMAKGGQKPLSREGKSGWRLLDYGDIVVHIFTQPMRGFYDLEGLWIEAPRVEVASPR